MVSGSFETISGVCFLMVGVEGIYGPFYRPKADGDIVVLFDTGELIEVSAESGETRQLEAPCREGGRWYVVGRLIRPTHRFFPWEIGTEWCQDHTLLTVNDNISRQCGGFHMCYEAGDLFYLQVETDYPYSDYFRVDQLRKGRGRSSWVVVGMAADPLPNPI